MTRHSAPFLVILLRLISQLSLQQALVMLHCWLCPRTAAGQGPHAFPVHLAYDLQLGDR